MASSPQRTTGDRDGARSPAGTGDEGDVLSAFRARVAEHGGHPAIVCDGDVVSYRDLARWSDLIARKLRDEGIGRGDRVAVSMEPGAAAIAVILGVLKRAAAYVPLSVRQPRRLAARTVADAQVSAVCVDADRAADHPLSDRPLLPVGRLPRPGELAAVPEDAAVPEEDSAVPLSGDDPAYLIYTSGSTGRPRGVLVEHAQLAASTRARRAVYPGRHRFLLVSPLAFDSSVAGLWGTLSSGGTLVVATTAQLRDVEALVGLVAANRVTHLLCIPALYDVMLDEAARRGDRPLTSLEVAIVAGEALPQPLVGKHFRVPGTQTALVNEYGPTECTVWATYHRFERDEPVSIGTAVPGTRLYVLDDDRRPVADERVGQLYVGGPTVARGYWNDPEATAAAFLPDPFAEEEGARMYATGDQVRRRPSGQLEFVGRLDDQVKVRGQRIELGAVEAALAKAPGIRRTAVLADEPAQGLRAFVETSAPVSADELRRQLREGLPDAMIPARIEILDRLPVTANGKVDRSALRRRPDAGTAAAPPEPSAPGPATAEGGPVVDRVKAAWREVLDVDAVPTDVNFFDLGGNSLLVFRLQDALKSHVGRRPDVVDLFAHPTVAAQALLFGPGDAEHDATEARSAAEAARRRRIERAAARRQVRESGGRR